MSANESTQVEVALPEVGIGTSQAQEAVAAVQAQEHNRKKLINEYPDWFATLVQLNERTGGSFFTPSPSPDYGYSNTHVFIKNPDPSIQVVVEGKKKQVEYLSFYDPKKDDGKHLDQTLNLNDGTVNKFVHVWQEKPMLPNAERKEYYVIVIGDRAWTTLVPDVIRAKLKQVSAMKPGPGALPDLNSLVTQASAAQ